MNGAAPIQCVNCGTEQPFARIYCVECGSSLDAAKPRGQTWAGTFLVIILFFSAALLVSGVGILALGSVIDTTPPSPLFGVAMLIAAAGCIWGIWRLARR